MEQFSTRTANINRRETNSVLADPLRVNIVEALRHAEMSLGELAEMFEVDERLMLYHLRRLIRAGMVAEHRVGAYVTYEVANPAAAEAGHVLYELWAEEASRPRSHRAVAL